MLKEFNNFMKQHTTDLRTNSLPNYLDVSIDDLKKFKSNVIYLNAKLNKITINLTKEFLTKEFFEGEN